MFVIQKILQFKQSIWNLESFFFPIAIQTIQGYGLFSKIIYFTHTYSHFLLSSEFAMPRNSFISSPVGLSNCLFIESSSCNDSVKCTLPLTGWPGLIFFTSISFFYSEWAVFVASTYPSLAFLHILPATFPLSPVFLC